MVGIAYNLSLSNNLGADLIADSAKPYAGKLIAVEGLDGSGKSTQLYLLKRWLELQRYKVFFTEWNSSLIVKKATKKGKKQRLLTPTTFSLIHATDFADRYERQIVPLLRAGYILLSDRYIFTAFARDKARGCDNGWLESLYGFAVKPDIVFFFKLPVETAVGRILSGRPNLKYFEAGMDLNLSDSPYDSFRIFQGMINERYVELSDKYGFKVIDATRPIAEQQREVRRIVSNMIDLPQYRWRTKVVV